MSNMLPGVTFANLVNMVKNGKVLNAPPNVLMDVLLREGDDSIDCWQGIYWTIQNLFLMDMPPLCDVRRSGTIIACGSGPSLSENLDKIRDLQDSAYIVAAESTTQILIENGIFPHMVTPVERIDVGAKCLDGSYLAAYGGSHFVPHEPHKFKRQYLLMGYTPITEWSGVNGRIPLGSLSGSQSVLNSIVMGSDNTAEVYLVGQDLCVIDDNDHCEGYKHKCDIRMPVSVECNDGIKRQSSAEWARASQHISQVCERLNVNLYNVSERGTKMSNTTVRQLPSKEDSIIGVESLVPGSRPGCDMGRLKGLVRSLPDDIEKAVAAASKASNVRQLDPGNLINNDNKYLLSYLLQPLYAQISIERVLGNKDRAVSWFAEAFGNIYNGLWRSLKETAACV